MSHPAPSGDPRKGTFLVEPTRHFSSGESSVPGLILKKKSNNSNPTLSACQFPPSFPLSGHRKLRILKGEKPGSGEGNSQTMKSQHQPNIKHRPWKRAALDVSGIWQLWLRLPEMDGWSQEHD